MAPRMATSHFYINIWTSPPGMCSIFDSPASACESESESLTPKRSRRCHTYHLPTTVGCSQHNSHKTLPSFQRTSGTSSRRRFIVIWGRWPSQTQWAGRTSPNRVGLNYWRAPPAGEARHRSGKPPARLGRGVDHNGRTKRLRRLTLKSVTSRGCLNIWPGGSVRHCNSAHICPPHSFAIFTASAARCLGRR